MRGGHAVVTIRHSEAGAVRAPRRGAARELTTDRSDAGRRLDLVLQAPPGQRAGATRTRIQAWIEDGQVTVNGVTVRRVATPDCRGRRAAIGLPTQVPRPVMAGEDVPVTVLYEDPHLLALDKPAGIVVHPTHAHLEGTLMNALLWHARGWPDGQRPSLVGRLDKLTLGARAGREDGDDARGFTTGDDVARVSQGLRRAGLRPGRPRWRHRPPARSGRRGSTKGGGVRIERRTEPDAVRAAGPCSRRLTPA